MMTKWLAAAAILACAAPAAAQAPELKLWRLDCGSINVSDFDVFSDTYLHPDQPKLIIQHELNYVAKLPAFPQAAE